MFDNRILKELQEYVEEHLFIESFSLHEADYTISSEDAELEELETYIHDNRQSSFSVVLFQFIDEKGLQDSEVYKKAGIDRRHFSKIRSNPDYRTSKQTAIAFVFALSLNKTETEQLLSSAGYTLSNHDTYDLVIQFCLEKEIYDMDHVNQALDYFGLKTLVRV